MLHSSSPPPSIAPTTQRLVVTRCPLVAVSGTFGSLCLFTNDPLRALLRTCYNPGPHQEASVPDLAPLHSSKDTAWSENAGADDTCT